MAAVLAILGRLLGYVLQILGIAQVVQGLTEHAAQEHSQYQIESIVTTAGLSIANPTYGLSAAHTERGTILTAIAAIPTTEIPAHPPQDWVDDLSTGNAHWLTYCADMANASASNFTDTLWREATTHTSLVGGQAGYLDSRNPDFCLLGDSALTVIETLRGQWGAGIVTQPDRIDWSDWDGAESLVTFLNRVESTYLWTYTGPDGIVTNCAWTSGTTGGRLFYWRCRYQDWQLPFISGRVAAAIAGVGRMAPPIWPGLANVTLGTPVSVLTDTEVVAAMDGALWHTDTAPPRRSRFVVNGHAYDYHLGSFAFTTDDGQAETFGYLGWVDQILVPRLIARPASVLISLGENVTGTLTPWTYAP